MVDQITPRELADRLDAGERIALVDTRTADSFEAWHVTDAENVPYHPHEGLEAVDMERVRTIADGTPIVTICGKGLTSTPFAFDLEERGFEDVTVVKGGMADWSTVYEIVPIETASDDLVVRQLQRRGNGCLGYVVGDRSTGVAAVVDPTRVRDAFEIAAEEAGLTIEHVLDTHVHADHLSGGPALAERVDAPYYLGAAATERDVEYDFRPLGDGEVLSVGAVDLTTLQAPGHTSEMVNYRVNDEFLLTGDTLFVESVGRTELQFDEQGARAGARLLYRTLRDRILELPDDTRILPGHVSVTQDGRFVHGKPGQPVEVRLADLRNHLALLGLDENSFVERLVENAPEKPRNYERIVAANIGKEVPDSEGDAAELELGPNNCAA